MTRDEKGRFVKGVSGNPKGRSPKEREIQYRDVLLSAVSLDDWRKIVWKARDQALKGDAVARKWLSDYLIGPPVEKKELTGAEGRPLGFNFTWIDEHGNKVESPALPTTEGDDSLSR